MMRATALFLPIMLAACGSGETPAPKAPETTIPEGVATVPVKAADVSAGEGTPNKDRVATLGLLNKRNNLTQDLVMKTGETRRVGDVIVKLASCERSLPWEKVEEEGAFVQVFVFQRPANGSEPQWQTVFSGWLFKNSPSLNVVEHPVYDVWIKDCAMSFPGEEARPEASAADKSAEKASGN